MPTRTTATTTAPNAATRPTRLTERISASVSRLPRRLRHPWRISPTGPGQCNKQPSGLRWLSTPNLDLPSLPGCWNWHTERSEEHTSELQSRPHLVCRLLLEKKKDPEMLRR